MSGFGTSPVYRMKHTFTAVSKKCYETIEQFSIMCSSEGSYKVYRDKIESVKPPAIPFLFVPFFFHVFDM